MTRMFPNPKPHSDITPPKQLGGGLDIGFVRDTWEGLAISRCRTNMFRALIRLDIGVNQVEDYNAALNLQLKSRLFKGRGGQGSREVVRVAMKYKLRDSIQTTNDLSRVRDGQRRILKLTH